MNFKKNNRIVSIGNGFSLWGFVFSWGWLLARGIWVFGIIFMIIEIPLGFYAFAGNAAFGSVSNNTFNFQHSYLLIPSILLFIIHMSPRESR